MNTQVKINYTEPLYTLSEARDMLIWEQCKQREKRRQRQIYFTKQKLSGITLILMSIVIPFLILFDYIDSDIGFFSILFFPLGIFLFITKQKIMTF